MTGVTSPKVDLPSHKRQATSIDSDIALLILLLAGSFVTGVGCFLLIIAWREMPDAPMLLWFAGALVIHSVAAAALAAGYGFAIPMLVDAGAGLTPLATAFGLAGIRVFHQRTPPWWMIAATAAWVCVALLSFAPSVADSTLAVGMVISSGLMLRGCYELWLGRAEHLTARWPLAAILAVYAVVLLAGAVDVAVGNEPSNKLPPVISWFGLVQLEFVMALLGVAVLGVLLCRQRIDARSLATMRLDFLTGVANRADFFTRAATIVRQAALEATPTAVIVFDLDHFKGINDTYGHPAGDGVLRSFSRIASGLVRPSDALGRIGGEEFCVILPDTSGEDAYVIAERIRHAFAATPLVFGGCVITATVSAGVASKEHTATVDELIEDADRALYRAKSSGRNRVELAAVTAPVQAAHPLLAG